MKKLMLLAACAMLALPTAAKADTTVRDRAAEAQDVASFLNLESSSYRVVTATEANQLRGTGGHHGGGSLLAAIGVKANVNVNAKVNVASIVNVKANVNVKVKVGAGVRIH